MVCTHAQFCFQNSLSPGSGTHECAPRCPALSASETSRCTDTFDRISYLERVGDKSNSYLYADVGTTLETFRYRSWVERTFSTPPEWHEPRVS